MMMMMISCFVSNDVGEGFNGEERKLLKIKPKPREKKDKWTKVFRYVIL